MNQSKKGKKEAKKEATRGCGGESETASSFVKSEFVAVKSEEAGGEVARAGKGKKRGVLHDEGEGGGHCE